MRHTLRLALATALVGFGAWWLVGRADEPVGQSVGKTMADFTLKDADGNPVTLRGAGDAKATVVLFIGTECPINNLYMLRLTELEAEWAPKGVRFLAINSNSQDTAEAIKAHAKKHSLTLPVLLDGDGRIAERFGARRTPEAFVL